MPQAAFFMIKRETKNYAMLVFRKLETFGLHGLEQAEVTMTYTPEQLERDTSAHRGVLMRTAIIYGYEK